MIGLVWEGEGRVLLGRPRVEDVSCEVRWLLADMTWPDLIRCRCETVRCLLCLSV